MNQLKKCNFLFVTQADCAICICHLWSKSSACSFWIIFSYPLNKEVSNNGVMNENKSSQESASEKKEDKLNDSSAAMKFDNITLQAGKSSVKANDIYCRRFQDWFVR